MVLQTVLQQTPLLLMHNANPQLQSAQICITIKLKIGFLSGTIAPSEHCAMLIGHFRQFSKLDGLAQVDNIKMPWLPT